MRYRCLTSTLAWLLAIFGAGLINTGPGLILAQRPYPETSFPTHRPHHAEGQPLLIQAQAEVRCRWAYTSKDKNVKMYRIFLGHSMVPYPAWCTILRRALWNRCWNAEKLDIRKVQWMRCDTDSRDVLWQTGTLATFKLWIPEESKPSCVAEAVRVSLPGSEVDWMGAKECYQGHGYEIEY